MTRPRDCRARLARLFAYLDGELSPSHVKRLEAHLAACACCGTLERDLRRSIAACRAAGKVRLPAPVRTRARLRVSRLLAITASPRRVRRPRSGRTGP